MLIYCGRPMVAPMRQSRTFSLFITHYFRDVEDAIPYATKSHLFIIHYPLFSGCRGRHTLRDKVAPFHYSLFTIFGMSRTPSPTRQGRTYSLFITHYFRDVEDAIPYISIYLLRKFDIFHCVKFDITALQFRYISQAKFDIFSLCENES